MWAAIAEEDTRCTECYHMIPAGANCLSQMPAPMPEGFRRRKYHNFCLECDRCNAEGRESSCYARSFDHWYAYKAKVSESVLCGYCGEAIPDGTMTVAQRLYTWPEIEPVSESEGVQIKHGGATTGVAAGAATTPNPVAWHNLSRATQRRFMRGGLRHGMGRRSDAMAQRLFEKEVPEAIRRMGEPAVRDFLKGKQFSHIRSVRNAPRLAKSPGNVVLEDGATNFARGSRNMTSAELAAAGSASRASAIRIGVKSAVKGGARAGLIAAAMEAVVSVPENVLHYKRGRKSREQAVKDTAKDTAVAAGVGVATAGVVKGAALVGVSPSLGPAGVPLAVAGVSLMVGTAAYRLYKAAKHDLPLDEYHVYFCESAECKTKYAQRVTDTALGTRRAK